MSRISSERYRSFFKGKDTNRFGPMDFIHRFTSPMLALLFTELFWPEFIEIENMIFLESTFEDESDYKRLMDAVIKYKRDRNKVEKSFNTIEVPSLFGATIGDTTDNEDQILAKVLASMWKARLVEKFPERDFVVEVIAAEETGGEIAVRFYQQLTAFGKGQNNQLK